LASRKKKKVLFLIDKLGYSGVSRSIVALLKQIDYEQNDIDLMIAFDDIQLVEELPTEVNVLFAPKYVTSFLFTKESFFSDIKQIKSSPTAIYYYITIFLKRIMNRTKYTSHLCQLLFWELSKNKFNYNSKYKYDIAISFSGPFLLFNQFIIDKIIAEKKITWIHGNYDAFGTNSEVEKKNILRFDKVITVSNTCKLLIEKAIPQLNGQVEIIENITDKNNILMLASKKSNVFNESKAINILSVTRLTSQKGLDLGVSAIKKLVEDKYNVKWTIIGDGAYKETLQELIIDQGMEDSIILMGSLSNPYPYILECDIFMHPSRGEGKSMSVDEAKLMEKPIIITNYPSVGDQIEHLKTGYIVNIDSLSIFNGLRDMLDNKEINKILVKNLSEFELQSNTIIDKFYKLIQS
jgi:glycosyltransferase involved in cell wall biosynthesis